MPSLNHDRVRNIIPSLARLTLGTNERVRQYPVPQIFRPKHNHSRKISHSLGDLDILPPEVLLTLIEHLDLDTFRNFCYTCNHSRILLTGHGCYRFIKTFHQVVLQALYYTKASRFITLGALHSAVTDPRCALCKGFATYIYLPTGQRTCRPCLGTKISALPIPEMLAGHKYHLPRSTLEDVPQFILRPSELSYGHDGFFRDYRVSVRVDQASRWEVRYHLQIYPSSRSEPIRFYDPARLLEAAIRYHGSEEAIKAAVRQGLEEILQGYKGDSSSQPPGTQPLPADTDLDEVDVMVNPMIRIIAVVNSPVFDKSLWRRDKGVFCDACYIDFRRHAARGICHSGPGLRLHSRSEWREHLEDYGWVVDHGKTHVKPGTKPSWPIPQEQIDLVSRR